MMKQLIGILVVPFMENCIKCNSGDVCLSCKEGYQINDNKKCEKINSEEDEENKLSTGEIIGIVFGCIGFLLIVIISDYSIA